MCFGVRFSLYLASWLSDFDHFLSVCVVFGPLVFSPENGGGGQAPPGSASDNGQSMHNQIMAFITLNKVAEMFSEIASGHVTLFVVDT